MKNKFKSPALNLSICSVALLGLVAGGGTSLHAQTPATPSATGSITILPASGTPLLPSIGNGPTNLGQILGLPSSVTTGLGSLFQGFVDASPYISNDIVNFDAGMLYNKTDTHGKTGAYMALSMPTTQQSAVGVGGFYQNGQLGNATVNLTLGTTVSNLSILSFLAPVYTFVSSGPDYDFSKDPNTGKAAGIGAYNAAGFMKMFDPWPATAGSKVQWYQNLKVGWKVGVYNITQVPGTGIFGGLSASKYF